MAIQLNTPFDTPYGSTIPSTHWRWVGLSIDVTKKQANITLLAYINETAFNTGKLPIGQRQYQIENNEYLKLTNDIDNNGLDQAINMQIMLDPFFNTATQI